MSLRLNNITEKLQDAISLLILLENDCDTQHSDDVCLRTIRMIHEILKSAQVELAQQQSLE